jgi:tetratricopeptide (TPR) repeat protein
LMLSAIWLQMERDRAYAKGESDDQLLYVTSGRVIEKLALSYDAILADAYWIRALQHYGRGHLEEGQKAYDLLYPLLDLATTLDPNFIVAYRFGAPFLSEPRPDGAGRPDLAIALLKKGIGATPDKWDYYHDIGFVYYWHLHDYERAAEWFNRGGDRPGAPWWLKTYAAVMLVRGGDRQASRFMWQQMEQSESAWLREVSSRRLMQLDALDQIDTLQRISEGFTAKTGQHARSWEQLMAAGFVHGIPLDPDGTPYMLDELTGDVGLGPESSLKPLPTEPAAAPELLRALPPPVQ